MHIHILGICGTFMAGIALLARQLGYKVTGSDSHVYPPMSVQLAEQGIEVMAGYHAAHLNPSPDQVVVGNALSRGNEAVEAMLNQRIEYCSGPAWLAEHVLKQKKVIVVAGTHGKTTTSSMVAWVLEYAGLNPGFLIGGVPGNFEVSARLTDSEWVVLEGDEYDSAFFDKRSKFVHYRPHYLIINNLEFDHADIFKDLAAIQTQFHHVVRIVPGQGLIIYPLQEQAIVDVIQQGCWTPTETIGPMGRWRAQLKASDGSHLAVFAGDKRLGELQWSLLGEHNVNNALATLACVQRVGVKPAVALEALQQFRLPKRRMEKIIEHHGITLYDDFAHHPTAIETTLQGLRQHVGKQKRIFVLLEPRSYTMKAGVHKDRIAQALSDADKVWLFQSEHLDWDLQEVAQGVHKPCTVLNDIETIVEQVVDAAKVGDTIITMSNGAFGGIQQKLKQALEK